MRWRTRASSSSSCEVAGICTRIETETIAFAFSDFSSAWDALASVTIGSLPPDRVSEAKDAVIAAMGPEADRPLRFRNDTQFLMGDRA